MRVVALMFLVACGGKHGLDCEAYAAKFTDTITMGALNPNKDAPYDGSKRDCEKGRVDEKQYNCVMNAKSPDDIFVCQGLTPPPHN